MKQIEIPYPSVPKSASIFIFGILPMQALAVELHSTPTDDTEISITNTMQEQEDISLLLENIEGQETDDNELSSKQEKTDTILKLEKATQSQTEPVRATFQVSFPPDFAEVAIIQIMGAL